MLVNFEGQAVRPFQPYSVVEIFAQRRSPVFRLAQATPLKLGDDEVDKFAEIVGGVKAAAQNEAAVGAGFVVQLLELVDDRLRRSRSDQDPLGS